MVVVELSSRRIGETKALGVMRKMSLALRMRTKKKTSPWPIGTERKPSVSTR